MNRYLPLAVPTPLPLFCCPCLRLPFEPACILYTYIIIAVPVPVPVAAAVAVPAWSVTQSVVRLVDGQSRLSGSAAAAIRRAASAISQATHRINIRLRLRPGLRIGIWYQAGGHTGCDRPVGQACCHFPGSRQCLQLNLSH